MWYDMYDMYGMVWYGMVWYGMVWYVYIYIYFMYIYIYIMIYILYKDITNPTQKKQTPIGWPLGPGSETCPTHPGPGWSLGGSFSEQNFGINGI